MDVEQFVTGVALLVAGWAGHVIWSWWQERRATTIEATLSVFWRPSYTGRPSGTFSRRITSNLSGDVNSSENAFLPEHHIVGAFLLTNGDRVTLWRVRVSEKLFGNSWIDLQINDGQGEKEKQIVMDAHVTLADVYLGTAQKGLPERPLEIRRVQARTNRGRWIPVRPSHIEIFQADQITHPE